MRSQLHEAWRWSTLAILMCGVLNCFSKELARTEGAPSEHHVKFNEVCGDNLGPPRNSAKQLIGAACGGIQGGDLDGIAGVIKVGRDKLENFLAISMAMLSLPMVSEFQVRHFVFLEKCKGHSQQLTPPVIDEVVCPWLSTLRAS